MRDKPAANAAPKTTKLGRALLDSVGETSLRAMARELKMPFNTLYHIARNGSMMNPTVFLKLLHRIGEIDTKLYRRLLPWADGSKKH